MTCLVVDKMHESLTPMLSKIGVDVSYQPNIKREEIKNIISNYDGLIIRSKTFVDRNLLENANKLLFVARAGSGIDNLDVDYLNLKGVKIINAPEGNRDSVGEHTIGLILSLLHNLQQGHDQIYRGVWDREGNRGSELSNKTVGIIGYGHMGRTLAKKLNSFGCKILAYDKYHPNFENVYAKSASLSELMDKTDILSLHIPLTDETLNLTSDNFFSGFKKNIIFINTSRGEIAPLKSIANGIKSGKIVKAGLDVLENEKLNSFTKDQITDFEFLKNSKSVIFTPHVAGWSNESYLRINEILTNKIKLIMDNK